MFMAKQPACCSSCSTAKIYRLWLRWFNSSPLQKVAVAFSLNWEPHESAFLFWTDVCQNLHWTVQFSHLMENCSVLLFCHFRKLKQVSAREGRATCICDQGGSGDSETSTSIFLGEKINLAQAVIPNIMLSPCSHWTSLIASRLT